MSNAVSLKQWSEGATPEKDDLLSWSNLVFQRSLQVKNPEADPVSEYLFSKWSACAKDPKLTINTFERTFSQYSVGFQRHVMNTLIQAGVAEAVDFLDKVKGNGLLHRHLLTLPEVWAGMELHQQRDNLYTWFSEIVQFGKDDPNKTHPSWNTIKAFKTPKEKRYIFNAVLGEKMLSTFGLFKDHSGYFTTAVFHDTVKKMSECWDIHPAQVVYGLMLVDHYEQRTDYHRFDEFLEPYANDVRELIQFNPDPRSKRMSENLPESSRPATIDLVFAFALSLDPTHVFLDRNHMPKEVHDPEAAQALSSAF